MAKTKIRERIVLSSGQIMTLGEAIDQSLVVLRKVDGYARRTGEPNVQYLATEVATGNSWDVGKTLYESRTSGFVSISKEKS